MQYNDNNSLSYTMIPLLGSQLEFYQKKSYKLEMEVITLQQELLSLKTSKGDQYKIKYEMLLDRLAEQSQLKESKINQSLLQQEKTINQINQKWQNILNQKFNDFKVQIQALTLQKSSLKNKTIELQLKCIKLQKQIDDGDTQVLRIKLDSLKKDNERLRKDNDDLYRSRQETLQKLERECEMKIEAIKQRQKTFYRQQIQTLEKRIEQTQRILESQRQKISPERQNLITSLKEEIISLKRSHDEYIQRLTAVIQKRSKEMKIIQEQAQTKQKSNFQIIDDLTNQLRTLEDKLFRFQQDKDMEIKVIQSEMSKIRQKQADDLKRQLQKMKNEFDQERQQWKRIQQQSKDQGSLQKKDYQQQKQRFIQQKNRLKTKITELKIRLKERQEDKGNGQTEILIKSLRQMNNNQAHFSNYEDAITFMDRQVRKASIKIEEKNRQIANLLQQLKTMQRQTQNQISQVKQKSKSEQKKLYDKIFAYEQQVDNLNQKLKEKQKYIKKKEADLSEEKQGHQSQVQNLKKIIEQMQRDYKRLTGNKKNVEDQYREQRQNVISGKLDINQQRKKKWNDLIRQRNELQIVYRQRERQIRGEHEIQIDKLKRQKQRLIEEREQYKAEAELLRERLNESGQDNKENKIVDYQKRLATMDLEIALTQNLFSTLSNVTALKEDVSERQSSKVGSSHSFQIKVSDVITPLFLSNQSQKEDSFKGGVFSFTPNNKDK